MCTLKGEGGWEGVTASGSGWHSPWNKLTQALHLLQLPEPLKGEGGGGVMGVMESMPVPRSKRVLRDDVIVTDMIEVWTAQLCKCSAGSQPYRFTCSNPLSYSLLFRRELVKSQDSPLAPVVLISSANFTQG